MGFFEFWRIFHCWEIQANSSSLYFKLQYHANSALWSSCYSSYFQSYLQTWEICHSKAFLGSLAVGLWCCWRWCWWGLNQSPTNSDKHLISRILSEAEYFEKTLGLLVWMILVFACICAFYACVCRISYFRQFSKHVSRNLNP